MSKAPSLPISSESPVVIDLKSKKIKYLTFSQHGDEKRVHKLPDFSYCGYRGGGVRLPTLRSTNVKTIEPGVEKEDDQPRIQAAIDEISKLRPDKDGYRGTLIFGKGVYRLGDTIRIKTSGIVLRGETSETTLVATKREQHVLIQIQGQKVKIKLKNTVAITQDIVPMGASQIRVSSAKAFKIGDWISVSKKPTEKWISTLGMDKYGWKGKDYEMEYVRRVVNISDENTIHFDLPLAESIESRYGGGTVSLLQNGPMTGISEVGVENLCLVSEHSGEFDENHGWDAIQFRDASNCWVRDTICKKFGYAAVHMKGLCFQITVQDCAMLDPKSKIEGGRRYCFCVDAPSSRILFQRCFARNGRHSFVSGARVPGPIVFTHCLAVKCHNDCGPHHRYSVGQLYDNIETSKLSVQNRRHSGTGHGWTGNCVIFWSCKIREKLICETPKHGMNFAISCEGKLGRGVWKPHEPLGFLHAFRNLNIKKRDEDSSCCPNSLYLLQLEARLGRKGLEATTTKEQRSGAMIWSYLRKRYQEEDKSTTAEVHISLTPRSSSSSSSMYDMNVQNRSKTETYKRIFVKLELNKAASEVKGFNDKIESLKKVGTGVYQFWICHELKPGSEWTTGFKIEGKSLSVKRVYVKKKLVS